MMRKNKTVSVILPTFNEEGSISEMIRQINRFVSPAEIIVVDDNSSDNTRKIAAKSGKNVTVIHRTNERGVASAIYDGIKKSRGKIVVWMDADLSMPPKVIPEMVDAVNSGFDIAVGSRYANGAKDERSFSRVFTSRAFNKFAEITLNFGVKDVDSGFIAAKKGIFKKISFDVHGHGEYCVELLYNASKNGFKIKEIPYVFGERRNGKSKTVQNFLSLPIHGAIYCMRVLKVRFKK